VYQYGSQFLANVSSGFTPFFDPISGLSSADAATALEQFRDMRPCWVEPQSASGYILPAGLLQVNGITSQPGVLAQTHTAVVRALYIKGICDFGATFGISGDPRTASAVQQDLPDVMNRVLIIWRSEAVIPNLNLSLLAGLSEADRQTLTTAFLDLSKEEDGKALLSLSAGNYQIDDIKAVQDSIYDPLREVSDALNIDLQDMIGK
jgi:phosphonate transport system substrate-binding protein